MSRDKQIKEMANDIAQMCPDLVNSGCGDLSCVTCLARGLEQIGYHKASDLAEEIFAEIEKWLANDGDIRLITAEKLAELKKKYTKQE